MADAPRVWDAAYLDGRTARRQPARVSIGRRSLEIALPETGGRLSWPLAGVRQTQGFYTGEQVRLERGGDLAEALLIGDLAFLSALRAAAPEAAAGFDDPARRRRRARLAVPAALAAIVVALALYLWGLPALATIAAARVPVSWEVALGDATMAQLAPAERLCRDPARQRRLDEIAGVLLRTRPDTRYPFRVSVVNHPVVNALAAPGGAIVVFHGLLERTESAEELAGVLAHEIQHVLHRHATRAILRQASTGVLLAALTGDVGMGAAFGVEGARLLGDLRYSREAETEADRDGMRMLQAAAVDPSGALTFFRRAEKSQHGTPAFARYLTTHPLPGDRLAILTALAAESTRPPVKLLPGYDWKDIARICPPRR
jgi:predicted Zn-dependent protease